MTYEEIYNTFQKEICRNCKNYEHCQEELVIKIDNSIKCEKYERITSEKK